MKLIHDSIFETQYDACCMCNLTKFMISLYILENKKLVYEIIIVLWLISAEEISKFVV